MAEAPKIEVNVIYLTEDQLRNIIRDELNTFADKLEHSPIGTAPRMPYYPSPPYPDPLPWWQNPVICGTGTSAARPSEGQVVMNATGPGKEPPADMLKERGYNA